MSTLRIDYQKNTKLQAERQDHAAWISQRTLQADQMPQFPISLGKPSPARARATHPSPG